MSIAIVIAIAAAAAAADESTNVLTVEIRIALYALLDISIGIIIPPCSARLTARSVV